MNNGTLANATLACTSFDSLTDLLGQVQSQNLNITIQIQQCPDLCGLAWGAGNPDLSGIGSMIYQASLTILFGPMTSVLFSLSSPALKTRLEDLYHQFFYAMVLVVVPVLVASIVYLRQGAALYEVTYIYYLTTMQFLALFGTALAGAVFNWDRKNSKTIDKKDKPEDDVTERIIFTGDDRGVLDALSFGAIVTVACILGFGLYLGSLKWIRDSTVSPDLARGLVSACEDYGSIVPAIPTTNINWQAVGLAFRPWRYEPDQDPNGKTHFIVSWVFLAPIVVVCCAIAIGFCVVGLAWVLGMIFLLLSFPFSNFFITLAFTIGTMYCLVHMQENRGMIRALAGPQFQDDRWGFGQVLAVFVWTPLSANLLLWLAGLAASFAGYEWNSTKMGFFRKTKPGGNQLKDPEATQPASHVSVAVQELGVAPASTTEEDKEKNRDGGVATDGSSAEPEGSSGT